VQALWSSYGYLFIGTYFSVYFITLGGAFVLVRADCIPGPDVNEWLQGSFVKAWFFPNRDLHLSPFVSDFLKAWLVTKLTEPVRAVVTIAAVPMLARTLPPRIMRLLRPKP
jgi:hypothetical protein